VVRLTGADGGVAVCVSQGELLEVDLTAPASTPWSITADGSSLRRMPGTGRALVFEAVAPGTGRIRGTRRACPTPGASAVACGALQAYSVTVIVR
jgi:hypothetical protein